MYELFGLFFRTESADLAGHTHPRQGPAHEGLDRDGIGGALLLPDILDVKNVLAYESMKFAGEDAGIDVVLFEACDTSLGAHGAPNCLDSQRHPLFPLSLQFQPEKKEWTRSEGTIKNQLKYACY